jgi:hypothetical protein
MLNIFTNQKVRSRMQSAPMGPYPAGQARAAHPHQPDGGHRSRHPAFRGSWKRRSPHRASFPDPFRGPANRSVRRGWPSCRAQTIILRADGAITCSFLFSIATAPACPKLSRSRCETYTETITVPCSCWAKAAPHFP